MFIAMNKRGQSTLEYAVLIAIVVAGLITIQSYVKRGLQGKMRSASDDIGEQFSPELYTQGYDYSSDYGATETVSDGATRTDVTKQEQIKSDYEEELSELSEEEWPE